MTKLIRPRELVTPGIVVTNIGTNFGTAPTVSITCPTSIPAGSLIVVVVAEYGGAGTAIDAAKNIYTRILSHPVINGRVTMFYAWNTAALNANDSIAYIKPDGVNGAVVSAFYATGVLNTSDPHDSSIDTTVSSGNTGANGPNFTPVVSSNVTDVGNLVVAYTCWNNAGISAGLTQSPGWTFPLNEVNFFGPWGGLEIAGGHQLADPAALQYKYNPKVNFEQGVYFAGITAFKAAPAIVPVPPQPPPADEFDECQNPIYPRDRFLTEDEFNAQARHCERMRAISPGERVCILDYYHLEFGPEQDPIPHLLSHESAEYLDWRHNNLDPRTDQLVADGDPWTPWLTADQWAEIAPAPPPPPPFPTPPVGWNVRMQVVPAGIPQMNGTLAGMLGYTFVTKTPPVQLSALVEGGVATRITLVGNYQTIEAYVSPAFQNTFVVHDPADLHRLTVNGQTTFTVNGSVVTDPLPYGFDGSGGFLVTAHVSAAPGTLGTREPEPGWASRWKPAGNWTTQLDKSGSDFTDATQDSLSLLMVEGYYGST